MIERRKRVERELSWTAGWWRRRTGREAESPCGAGTVDEMAKTGK